MKKVLFLLALFAASVPVHARDLPVDLSSLDVYVREGFEAAWAKNGPSEQTVASAGVAAKSGSSARLLENGDEKWYWLKASRGNRPVRIRDLPFPGQPKPALFSMGEKPRSYTVCFPVHFSSPVTKGHSLGVALPRIGQNWAVYFNGTLVRSEVYLSKSGRILRERSMRDQVVEIPPALVREGANMLSFRVTGDPTTERTGFYNAGGYVIDRYLSLLHPLSGYIDAVLIGVYFFFGLYHFVLFAWRRREKFNLTFSFTSVLIAVYFLTRTSLPYMFVSDTRLILYVELTSVMLAVPVFVIFLERIIHEKISIAAWGYFAFSLVCAAVSAVFPRGAVFVWQASLAVAFPYVIIFDIMIPLSAEIMKPYRAGCGALRSAARGIFLSVPGNLSVGVLVVFSGALVEIITMKLGRELPLTKYTTFAVVMGIVIMLANRFLRVQSKVEEFNASLERKVDDRTKELVSANGELEAAMNELESANETLADANLRLREASSATDSEIAMAARVQENIFPERSPEDETWDIACAFKPMSGVSGDLYNFHYHNEKLSGVSLFDVSGHGIASGLVTLLAHSVIARRFTEGWNEKLHHSMERINEDLVRDIGSIDNYLTGVLIRFSGLDIEYVNAGHPDLLFRKGATGKVKMVEPKDREFKGCFLGVPGMEHPFATIVFRMEREDAILLYSDGLNEGMNPAGVQYGVARIMESLEKVPAHDSAHDILSRVIDDFVNFVGGESFGDDLTAILVKRKK